MSGGPNDAPEEASEAPRTTGVPFPWIIASMETSFWNSCFSPTAAAQEAHQLRRATRSYRGKTGENIWQACRARPSLPSRALISSRLSPVTAEPHARRLHHCGENPPG